MKKANIDIFMCENVWDLIGKQWMLITAGTDDNFNTMTASWGGIGWLWNKPVAFIFVRPERYTHKFIEQNENITLSFFTEDHRKTLQICGTVSGKDEDKVKKCGLTPVQIAPHTIGFNEARLTLVGRKIFKSSMNKDNFADKDILNKWYNSNPGGSLHDIYVLEILDAYTD